MPSRVRVMETGGKKGPYVITHHRKGKCYRMFYEVLCSKLFTGFVRGHSIQSSDTLFKT